MNEIQQSQIVDAVGTRSLDQIFDALSNERRRHILTLLCMHEPITVPDLVDGIARREDGDSQRQRTQIEISLQHTHLPLLEDYGLIERDSVDNSIELSETDSELRAILLFADEM